MIINKNRVKSPQGGFMKLNMKYRYLMSIGFLVFGFAMQAADYADVNKMGMDELKQLKTYLTYKGELVALTRSLIGSYKDLDAKNKEALNAVQEYGNVESILQKEPASNEDGQVASGRNLREKLADIRSNKERKLNEHEASRDKYFANRDAIQKFYNGYRGLTYNPNIAETTSFAQGIKLIGEFLVKDKEAPKASSEPSEDSEELQLLKEFCDYCAALESCINAIQKYVGEYKKDEKGLSSLLAAIEVGIRNFASRPIQDGGDRLIVRDAKYGATINLYKKNGLNNAPNKLQYSSTAKDWLANPNATMAKLGYNNPSSDKYQYRFTACLVHAFSLNVDQCLQACGMFSIATDKDGKTRHVFKMCGFVEFDNGTLHDCTVEYFIDPATGSCFHRNLKLW